MIEPRQGTPGRLRWLLDHAVSVVVSGGKVDATADVQRAVNDAGPGGWVYYPEGEFLFLGTVNANQPNQTHFGPGRLIMSAAGVRTNATIEFFNVTASGVRFDGLTFDGKSAAWAITPSHDWMIFVAAGVDDCVITHCIFKNMSRPVGHLAAAVGVLGQSTSHGSRIESNTFRVMGGGAIFLQASDCIARGNIISACGDAPIAINSVNSRGCVVAGNIILDTDQFAAIAVEEGAYDWVITDNIIRGCERGFQVLHSAYGGPALGGGLFANNQIIDTTTALAAENFAIHINSSYYKDLIIRGNRCSGLLYKTAGTAFLYVDTASDGLVIEDNIFESKGQAVNGIVFASVNAHDRLSIRRNTLISTFAGSVYMTRGIWVSGASTFDGADIAENIIQYCTEGVRFAGGGGSNYNGTLRDNRFPGTINAYLTVPLVGSIGQTTLPHSYDGSLAARELSVRSDEGWTPVVAGVTSAGAGTYTAQQGRFHKIGKLVFFECRVAWTAHTGTGQLRITSLPFPLTASASGSLVFPVLGTFASNPVMTGGTGTSTLEMYNAETSAAIAIANAGTVLVSGVYITS